MGTIWVLYFSDLRLLEGRPSNLTIRRLIDLFFGYPFTPLPKPRS
jgi:hypothetical protein